MEIGKLKRVLKAFPCTAYGVVVLVAYVCLMFASEGSSYDDGGFGLWMFLLGMVLGVFGFPFYLTHEFLFSVNDGRGFAGMAFLSSVIGLLVFMAGDLLLWHYRLWKGGGIANESKGKDGPN